MTQSEPTAAQGIPIPPLAIMASLVAGGIALGFFLRTLHPGVGPSLDSMELQIAVLTGGVIHPPGSPQYLLLGQTATRLIPAVDPAAVLNALSALFGAGTIVLVALAGYRLTGNVPAGVFAALSLALGPRLWYQASIAELYTLNALYLAAVLYCLLSGHLTGRIHFFWAASVLYAFSFGNHYSMILILPTYLLIVWLAAPQMVTSGAHMVVLAGIVIASALQYLYIPIRMAVAPPFCNYCSLGLLDYLTGGGFKSAMFALPATQVLDRVAESMWQLGLQFLPWGCGLGIIGGWEMARHNGRLAAGLGAGLLLQYMFVMGYAIPDWHDFMTPIYVVFSLFLAYGLYAVWEAGKHMVPLSPLVIGGLTGMLALGLGLQVYANLPDVDQRDATALQTNSRALVSQVEPGSWLLIPPAQSPSYYYSWAVRYASLEQGLALTMVAPPELDPPPGPPPHYLAWREAAPALAAEALREADMPLYILDPTDLRAEGWWLLPICAPGGTAVGYELVAVGDAPGAGRELNPLVAEERWASIEESVVPAGHQIAATCTP